MKTQSSTDLGATNGRVNVNVDEATIRLGGEMSKTQGYTYDKPRSLTYDVFTFELQGGTQCVLSN